MRVRVATFNLENLDAGPDAAVSLDERVAILRPQIERLEADILCLQEIQGDPAPKGKPHGLSALAALIADTSWADCEMATTRSRSSGGALDVHNLAILSRFPIDEVRQVRHDIVAPPHFRLNTASPPQKGAPAIEWDRPLLYARIWIGSLPLHVLNLHLRAPLAAFVPGQKWDAFTWRSTAGWAEGYFLATVKRAGQALEARLFVDGIFDRDPRAAIVVAGDCNAELRAPSMRLLKAAPDDTGDPGLAVRALIAVEEVLPAERRFSVIHGGDRVMLDHLLVSPAFHADFQGVEIQNEDLRDEMSPAALAGTLPDSFHAPMVAEFELPD